MKIFINLYCSPDAIRMIKSRRMRSRGHVARKGRVKDANKILVGESEGKKPFGRPRCKWEDGLKSIFGSYNVAV
jgi:hypothetical protein